ncbi:hypothetical protein [Sulfurimonas sp.]|jgi:hypothetical protein|nr:hypothetical protein [Sulfurimonas sp.]MBT5933762.1 hypothetical protein [Sulfurimonas sp.]
MINFKESEIIEDEIEEAYDYTNEEPLCDEGQDEYDANDEEREQCD